MRWFQQPLNKTADSYTIHSTRMAMHLKHSKEGRFCETWKGLTGGSLLLTSYLSEY